MSRDWKISILGAVAFHVAVLWGFQVALSRPPKLLRDSAVEVTLVAAPAAVAPAPAPPVETPPEPKPPEIKPPAPLPVAEPEPVVAPPQPIVQPPPPTKPAPPVTVAADNPSPTPAIDKTTVQAQPGESSPTKYRRNPKPAYPPLARRRGQEGLVLLTVKVTTDGRVSEATLKQSSGYALLDDAALQGVRRWEFEPARFGAIAVASEIEVPVRFQLKE